MKTRKLVAHSLAVAATTVLSPLAVPAISFAAAPEGQAGIPASGEKADADNQAVLDALKTLDADRDVGSFGKAVQPWRRPPFPRQRMIRSWQRFGRHRDDDDDPPPCPAYAAGSPKGSGGAAFAVAEAVFA